MSKEDVFVHKSSNLICLIDVPLNVLHLLTDGLYLVVSLHLALILLLML
jgi:hypothetical protein